MATTRDRSETRDGSWRGVDGRRETGASPLVRYRCHACALEFVPRTPGVAPCPRCQSVGDHERVAVVGPGGGQRGV